MLRKDSYFLFHSRGTTRAALVANPGNPVAVFYYTATVLLLVKYDKSLVDDRGKLRVIKENYV